MAPRAGTARYCEAVSQENVERYRRGIDAWNRGALDEYLEDVRADWTFIPTGTFPGVAESYRGREGARRLWEDMRGPWDSQGFHFDVERIEDLGDSVLALCTIRARGQRSGAAVALEWAHVVTFSHDGSIVTRNYARWEEALEAVGLSK